MSSIAMAADSTHGRKHKAKLSRHSDKETRKHSAADSKVISKQAKTLKHVKQGGSDSGSDHDSDLDLSKELLPIAGYIGSSELLVSHMFCSISTKKLKAMLPEILKPIPLDELKSLCIEQLEGMSKKRISRILDGDDPDDISSSGTEDNVVVHSSDVEFKGDDNHTSADTTKKCYADTTHYESVAAAESSCVADSGVSITAAMSKSAEPVSYSSQSASLLTVAPHEILVDQDTCVNEGVEPLTAAYDLVEGAADLHELDYDEEPEVSEMPRTPASLPSLVSEPDDTCTPVKVLKMEQSAGDGCDSAASSVAEADSLHQQPSPRLVRCDDDVLASAENENNMNVESEHSSADRSFAATGTEDVVENSDSVADLQLGDKQDRSGAVPADYTRIADSPSVNNVSAGATRDTELTKDHAVLSSCSAMIIDVQDDEFSDEEMEDDGKTENIICEPSVQPLSSKPSIEQSALQQLGVKWAGNKSVVGKEGQKSEPTARVIRLNRNFPQQLTENVDTAESQHGGTIMSGQKRSQRPDYDAEHSNGDMLPQKTKAAVVARSNKESIGLKQSELDNSRKLSQPSQKFVAVKNLGPTRSRSGKMSAVNLRSKSSPDSVSVTCSESVSDECRKVRIIPLLPVLEDQQAGETRESRGSSESDSLSKTQLEILELEMRARAIKAMIRAQEEMELLESVEKKRHVMDLSKANGQQKAALQHSLARPTDASDRQPSASTVRSRGELRSLQSVIGRNIIKRAEYVARRQRRIAAAEGRFQQQKQFAELEQRRLSQAASRRTVRLQPDARWRPVRYVVASQSSPRVVRLRSARVGAFQRQRRLEVRRSLVCSDSSRGDKRRVLVSSDRRSVRMSSSSRPY